MVIWIDGANGVGKSHVAEALAKQLTNINAEYIESDYYWYEFLSPNHNIGGGVMPYCNEQFLSYFREVLEEKIECFKISPVVPMSLVDKRCQDKLLDYFEKKRTAMFYVILEADYDTIALRIDNDSNRNDGYRKEQKNRLEGQLKYLSANYPDALRIDTEQKSLDDIVEEILLEIPAGGSNKPTEE